jgi:hypothetical protein
MLSSYLKSHCAVSLLRRVRPDILVIEALEKFTYAADINANISPAPLKSAPPF